MVLSTAVKAGIAILALCALALPGTGVAASCTTAEPLFDLESGGGTPLRQPSDMTIHEGSLYVLDDLNGRVVRYGLNGSFHSSVTLPGGSQRAYLGLDFGGDDNLYVAAPATGKIVVLTRRGKLVREFDTGSDGDSEPVAVLVSRGTSFVIDNEDHSVKSFDLEGKLLQQWGGMGAERENLLYPFRIAQDGLGRLFVTDTLNSRIKVFTPKGELLFQFGTFGVTEGTLYRPAGLALWRDAYLLVADNHLGSLQAFDLQGEYRSVLCGSDGRPLLFENPVSLAAMDSTLFILEMGAGRVRALRLRNF